MAQSTALAYQWHSEIFECQTNDIVRFYHLLEQQINRLSLSKSILGTSGEYPVCLLQSSQHITTNPNLMISAGFHGEEAAGPWGLLHFLSSLDPYLFAQVNLSLLPLVNPTGFAIGQRFNQLGENPNHGFYLEDGTPTSGKGTSIEAKILMDHTPTLLSASRDGILTCHEDVLLTDTYIYSFEPQQTPGSFSENLRDTLGQFLPVAVDGEIDDCPVQNGIIFNHFDTSFESFLVQQGSRFGCCSETPGQHNIDQRILANAAIMTEFVNIVKRD